VAPDGAVALKALTGATYDVVLLDIGLPLIDGWRILSGLGPGSVPSVIVISARRQERDKVRAVDHRTLLREVWGLSYVHERNYLRTFIRRLRRKREEAPVTRG